MSQFKEVKHPSSIAHFLQSKMGLSRGWEDSCSSLALSNTIKLFLLHMVKLREIHSYSHVKRGAPGPRLHCWRNPKQLLLKARSNLAVDNCQAMLETGGSPTVNSTGGISVCRMGPGLQRDHWALVVCSTWAWGDLTWPHCWEPSNLLFLLRWVLYEEPNYRGRMYVVERGEFGSFDAWQARSANVQSIRRVINYF